MSLDNVCFRRLICDETIMIIYVSITCSSRKGLVIKICDEKYINDQTLICVFLGYARIMVDFLIGKYPNTYSECIYENSKIKLESSLDHVNVGDFVERLISTFKCAVTKLVEEYVHRIKDNLIDY